MASAAPSGAASSGAMHRDARLLFATRFVRMFSFGALAVALHLYLEAGGNERHPPRAARQTRPRRAHARQLAVDAHLEHCTFTAPRVVCARGGVCGRRCGRSGAWESQRSGCQCMCARAAGYSSRDIAVIYGTTLLGDLGVTLVLVPVFLPVAASALALSLSPHSLALCCCGGVFVLAALRYEARWSRRFSPLAPMNGVGAALSLLGQR